MKVKSIRNAQTEPEQLPTTADVKAAMQVMLKKFVGAK